MTIANHHGITEVNPCNYKRNFTSVTKGTRSWL